MRNVSGRLPQPRGLQRPDDEGRPGRLFLRGKTIEDQRVKVLSVLVGIRAIVESSTSRSSLRAFSRNLLPVVTSRIFVRRFTGR